MGGFPECGPWMDLPVTPGVSEQSRVCKCLRICGSPPTPWKPALNWPDLRRGPCMGKCLDNCSTQQFLGTCCPHRPREDQVELVVGAGLPGSLV